MKHRNLSKVISIILLVGMIFTMMQPIGSSTVAYAAEGDSVWTALSGIEEAATTDKSVAITMTTADGTTTYALPTANVAKAPAAKSVSVSDNKINISGTESDFGWHISKNDDGTYAVKTINGSFLSILATNNGVVIGNKPDKGVDWSISEGYLSSIDPKDVPRYVGVYNGQDWRCYDSPTKNISGQTLKFWAYEGTDDGSSENTGGGTGTDPGTDPGNDPGSDPGSGPSDPKEASQFKLTNELNTGDEVILYNANNKMAVNTTFNGYKIAGVEFTPENNVITTDNSDVVWTITVNDDKTVTFTQDDKTLGGVVNGNNNNLVITNAAHTAWTVVGPDSTDSNYYFYLGDITSKYGNVYLEYYNGFTLYGSNNPNKNAYGITVYKKVADNEDLTDPDPDPDPNPTGDKFGLAKEITTGDEVIIYLASEKLGVDNKVASNKITGISLTPEDGVITTDNTDVVWTVTKNSDGTYTFTQGDKTLGGVVAESNGKTYNNLVPTGATYTSWTLDGPDKTDFNYYAYLGDMTSSYGNVYLEYYKGFTLYGSSSPSRAQYGITFYKKGAEPEIPQTDPDPADTGDLITDLSQLNDGDSIAIYSPSHKTAASTKPNGDWYLKAVNTKVEDGKVVDFTGDIVWNVKKNSNGTYSFYSNNDDANSLAVWPSGNYAELTVNTNYNSDTKNEWTVTPAETKNCFYIYSPDVAGSNGQAYVEAYVRNGTEVFSGYFTKPRTNLESELALQFYKVKPEDALTAFDDGEWDGVLNKGDKYVIYNANAESSLGLAKEATYSLNAVETTITDDNLAVPGNGAYIFTVDTMGRYYSFEVDGKYLATNSDEELFFVDPTEDGKVPETAKWFLTKRSGASEQMGGDVSGYILYNKEAQYGGTPVCIEYFSSVFSGWTFNTKNDLSIYLFDFYKVTDDTKEHKGIVQNPEAIFDCEDYRYIEQDFDVTITLDDLAEEITDVKISFTAGSETKDVTEFEGSDDLNSKNYTFTIPAKDIDVTEGLTTFEIKIDVSNGYGISYSNSKTVDILDEPFFENLTPAPNSQTREEKKPTISAKIGNVGTDPEIKLYINDKEIEEFTFEDGVLSYTPSENLADGRTTAKITVRRSDDKEAEKSWSFTVGVSDYQLYFGQLHSHTTYSDGSGTLETALDYVASLPESANVQFVAFTDHSNYFDSTSAANPADALNDASLMTDASAALWNKYKSTVANFNASQSDIIAIAGFEMTWSGGPGHINTFDSAGIVSRNNADLNNKASDSGMKLYYDTINKGDSLNQFNHPGTTFGNFSDFAHWTEETDAHMFLVEVGNGEGQIGAGGYYPSYEQYIMALDKGWHVAPTNNQDNHKGRWGNANDARDVILTNDFSEQGIYNAIRQMRVYATEDKNLQINYTVNGEPMGTIFDAAPEKLDIEVTVYDPNESDSISSVEVVANGGKVVHTWSDKTELSEGMLSVSLDPEYSYYFVRVTQGDGDLAVTAPVWTGSSVSVGIKDVKSDSEYAVKNEDTTLTTTLYNNQSTPVTVKSLVYTADGSKVLGSDTEEHTIPAGDTIDVPFTFAPDTAKRTTITVTAVVDVDGKEFTFTKDITLTVRETAGDLPVSPITDVQGQKEEGYEYAIEGIVTSNASGYDKDTAFFDCIYVQDETGGICCFPVSGDFKVGDKVHVEGYTDFYQGEPELQVTSIEVIGSGSVEPTEVTAAEINNLSALGSLVTIKGTVESFEVVNGLIQTIMVKDENGDVVRVFIDGYITTGNEVKNCEDGAEITVTGISSYDDTFNAPEGPFPRIRIRDRADVVCTIPEDPEDPDKPVTPEDPDKPVTPEDPDKPVTPEDPDKPVTPEDPELRPVVEDVVPIPEALKSIYSTIEDLTKKMLSILEELTGKTFDDYVLLEVRLEVSDGSSWKEIDPANFPKDGVEFEIPIPDGASASDTFYALHMFGADSNGNKAGDTEQPAVKVENDALLVKTTGASPLLLAWNAKDVTTPDDNTGGDDDQGDNTGGDNTGGNDDPGDNTGDDNTGGNTEQPSDSTGGNTEQPSDNTGGDNIPAQPSDNTPTQPSNNTGSNTGENNSGSGSTTNNNNSGSSNSGNSGSSNTVNNSSGSSSNSSSNAISSSSNSGSKANSTSGSNAVAAKTGDYESTLIWVYLGAGALIIILGLVALRRRSSDKN